MKKYIFSLFVILFLTSCSEDDMNSEFTSNDGSNNPIENMNSNSSNFEGTFISGAHPTSGIATVNKENTELFLTNFKTDNGPKLLVYLSTNIDATEFVDLGDLKGIEGDFTYDIPENTDVSKYKFVNIWCVDFLVSFGTAELKKE